MLGDGIVSFGVPRPTTDFRNSKWSPKMQPSRFSLLATRKPGRREVDVALVAVKMHGDVLLDLLHAADLVHEVHVPRRAAELAVGDALQADVLLHLHDRADRIVLDGLQLRGADAAVLVIVARAQQLLRTQQAADVIGAKRRLRERS